MAIDVSNGPRIDETTQLYVGIRKYKEVTLAKYMPLFDAGGAATGNDILGLMAQTVSFDKIATQIVTNQTDVELQANWLKAYGQDVPGLHAEMIALNILVESLKTTIKNNAGLILGDFDIDEEFAYTALTGGQRAAIKNLLDPISAFIVNIAP